MKATELKIGDWVAFADVPVKVKEVKQDGVCIDLSCFDNGKGEQGNVEFEDLSPIPLTEDVLEKSGWRKSEYMSVRGRATLYRLGSATDKYRTVVCFYAQDIFLEMWQEHNIVRKEIKYVHQLQHLLWALGMDDDLRI